MGSEVLISEVRYEGPCFLSTGSERESNTILQYQKVRENFLLYNGFESYSFCRRCQLLSDLC